MPNAQQRAAANKSAQPAKAQPAKAQPAKAQPAKAQTPAKAQPKAQPANAPVSPARGLGLDFDALAAKATKVAALPKASRTGNGGGAKSNALKELVLRSHVEGPLALPAIAVVGDADKWKQSMGSAIRRAASLAGLGVSIRYEFSPDGSSAVVTIQGRDKK